MKTSILSTLALAGTLVAAVPTDNLLTPRAAPQDAAVSIVTALYYDVVPLAANITFTAISLNSASTTTDNTTAGTQLTTYISSINTLVTGATSQAQTLAATKRDTHALSARQAAPVPTNPLAAETSMVLQEVGTAFNTIIATLGLTAALSFLGPLVGSLSVLLASLIPVVNNLLALVQQLLDGLLGGLSLALAGLVL